MAEDGNPRLYLRNGEVMQRRMPSIQVIMTATPRQVLGGDTVTLTWGVTEGYADFHDWLGLFQENDDKKALKHTYVKGNKRGGEWSVEAPREAGKYVFRFVKSLFPYDLIHKDYLGLGRSNVWQVVEPGAHDMDMEASTSADSCNAVASPFLGLGASASDSEGGATPASSQGSASPMVSTSWIGLTPPNRTGSGHRRSGSGSSTGALLGGQLASHAEGIIGRLPVHPLAWILRQFSSEDELAGVRLEDVVELSHQVEDDAQACILAKKLAAAAHPHQPGPSRRAVVDAGGVWALLNLAKWDYPDIQRHAAHGLHSLVTHVPTLFGSMHDPVRRVLTFGADFPHDTEPLTQGALVQAGFYSQPLEPGSDRVICIECGVILEGWVQGQVPAEVHEHVSPHCRLLNWPNVPPSATSRLQRPTSAPVNQTEDLHSPPPLGQPLVGWGMMIQQHSATSLAQVTNAAPPGLEEQPPGKAGRSSVAWSTGASAHPAGTMPAHAKPLRNSSPAHRPSVVTWWPLGAAKRVQGAVCDDTAPTSPARFPQGSGEAQASSRRGSSAGANGTPDMAREVSSTWGRAADEAGGVGVLESDSPTGLSRGENPALDGVGPRTRVMDRSVARELLQSPHAEQALSALAASIDKTVQLWWYRLLAALAYAAGTTREFEVMCLPRLLQAVKRCKDEERLLYLLEALRWLALQPAARDLLIATLPLDTLINALPKWSGRNLEVANRNGAAPSDVWPRLLEHAMCILQHTFATLVARPDTLCDSTQDIPHGATAAVLCVLREAPFEHAEVQRSAVGCLHSLVAACRPDRSPPKETAATGTRENARGDAAGGGWGALIDGGRASSVKRKGMRDVREITSPDGAVKRLVQIMVRGGDLHLRTSTARLLGQIVVLRPCVCIEIASLGIVGDCAGSSRVDDLSAIEGITALIQLARDTGMATSSAASSGSSDVLSQRMVAKCLESISLTTYLDPSLKPQLIGMGFNEGDAAQALRAVGGSSVEWAVTWLTTEYDETPGGPEDEFEMVEESPLDLPGMLIDPKFGGLDCMAEMLHEQDAEVQVSLWKAISALTRVGQRCPYIADSKLGQEWILPLIADPSAGAAIMAGTDRNISQRDIAGAGGAARDSLGSCMLEVVANLAAHAETCQKLLPYGIVGFLASAAKTARSRDVVGARTCARGLFYTLNSPQHEGEKEYEAWWPSDPLAGGTQALLHLCTVCTDTGVQRWTGMAMHRLCLRESRAGSAALFEYVIANRGVQSLLHLVYSKALEVSAYAMATLALLSSSAEGRVLTASSSELVSAKRAIFLAGVMYPVNKLGRSGCFDSKLAAAHILANLSLDDSTLEDMLIGSDESLELAFHLLSLSLGTEGQAARHDGKLIVSSYCKSTSQTRAGALLQMKQCALEMLQAVCSKEKFQPRFLKLSGLQVLWALAQSEAAHETVLARRIVKILENLARNDTLRQVLDDGGVKDVVKGLFKRHEDPIIEASMEDILVLLNNTPARRTHSGASANPSHSGSMTDSGGSQSGAAVSGDWKVICQHTLASGDKEQWVFRVPQTLSFHDLQGRIRGKFGPVVITFQDDHDEFKLLCGDDMLAFAMSLPRAVRKRKLHIEVTPVRPRNSSQAHDHDPERNPLALGDDEYHVHIAANSPSNREHGQPQMQQHTQMSKLCDLSPNLRHGGENGEGSTLRWRLGKRIGEGAYAQVYQGFNAETGELMAIKQVSLLSGHENGSKRQEEVSALQREIEVMKQLQHPHIVKYLGTETTDGRLNIFLEWVSGGSIAQLISNYGALDEPVVRKYTRQILVGLDFLHDKGIVHCDIKGGNILVTEDGIIKLADFNSSKQLGNIAGGGSNPLRSLLGTPQFMAPEVIRQTGHGKKADIWSVGCTTIQMLTGAPPWDEISNKITLMFHIASCKTPPPPPDDASEDARDFLGQVLQIDPRDRPGCQELLTLPFCGGAKEKTVSQRASSGEIEHQCDDRREESESDGRGYNANLGAERQGDFFQIMRGEVAKRKGAPGM